MKHLPVIPALFLLAAACGKGLPDTGLTVRARLGGIETRATVAEDAGRYPVYWQGGDVISLNGTLSEPLEESLAGTAEAVFTFPDLPDGAGQYPLLYPGSTDGRVTLDGEAVPMAADAGAPGEAVIFRPLVAGIRIPVSGSLPLKSLTLSADGGEALIGTFRVSLPDGVLTPVAAESRLTRTFRTSQVPGTPIPCIFLIAPGAYPEGLTLQASAPDGTSLSWHFATGKTLLKGKMYTLSELAFIPPVPNPPDDEDEEEDPSSGGLTLTLEEMTEEWIDDTL